MRYMRSLASSRAAHRIRNNKSVRKADALAGPIGLFSPRAKCLLASLGFPLDRLSGWSLASRDLHQGSTAGSPATVEAATFGPN